MSNIILILYKLLSFIAFFAFILLIYVNLQLQKKIIKYNIEFMNIYNFNEKEFLLDFIYTLKYIVSINSFKSDHTIDVSQNDSHEFIILLISIYINKTSFLFAFIY